MIEVIQDFFSNIGGSFFAVFLISMLPICEAKIGIPFGMASEIWGEGALSPFISFLASFFCSSAISLLIIVCLKPVFARLRKTKTFCNLVAKLESKFKKQSEEIDDPDVQRHKVSSKWLAIMLFVAMPGPMTGIWAGSAIASFTELNLWQSFTAVSLGNLIGCLLVLFVCTIFKDSALFLLLAGTILAILGVAISLLSKHSRKTAKS